MYCSYSKIRAEYLFLNSINLDSVAPICAIINMSIQKITHNQEVVNSILELANTFHPTPTITI